MNEPKTNQKKELAWQAPEYQEYRKNPMWFVAFGLITALLVLYGIYTKSWTTAALFLLLGIMGIVYASRKPNLVTIKLDGSGVQVSNLLYSYKTIKKFWVAYNPPDVKCLYLETSAYLNRVVKIELGNTDPREVRELLKQYLDEDLEQDEGTLDAIARKLKF
jgi:hypothetical protein